MTTFIGIDPGLSGAITIMKGNLIIISDVPVLSDGTKRRYDIRAMLNLLAKVGEDCKAVIEDVHAMPGQGVTSMFSMGYGLGLWHMALTASGIPFERIRPAKWKSTFDLIKKEKDASRLKAREMFPALCDELARKKDDGRAESLLMAEYARRLYS